MSHAPVSVVVPCYQCAQTIERAVNSIVLQTMRPKEVILVDDRSDDATQKAFERISNDTEDNHCIRVVRLERNSGPATARNAGWNLATQPYIAFLDSDDSWHPQKIELQYKWMAAHPVVILTGHGISVATNPSFPHQAIHKFKAKRVIELKLLLANQILTSTVMCKRDIPFRFIAGKRYSEDYFLWLSLALRGYPLYRFDKPLTYAFKAPFGEGGLSSHLWQMEMGQLDTYRRIYREQLIGYFGWFCLSCLSLIKFARRLAVCLLFRNRKKDAIIHV